MCLAMAALNGSLLMQTLVAPVLAAEHGIKADFRTHSKTVQPDEWTSKEFTSLFSKARDSAQIEPHVPRTGFTVENEAVRRCP